MSKATTLGECSCWLGWGNTYYVCSLEFTGQIERGTHLRHATAHSTGFRVYYELERKTERQLKNKRTIVAWAVEPSDHPTKQDRLS